MASKVRTAPPTNGSEPAAAAQIEVRCPADGSLVGTIPDMGAVEVEQTAARLRAAQPAWEALGPRSRAQHLLAWLDWYMDNEQRILAIVQRESGKSWGDAAIETMVVVETINYFAKHADKFLRDATVRPHGPASLTKRLEIVQRPYQLVGLVSPWNYPVGMPMMDTPGALMAGAAVLTKPSEFTPLAWREMVRGWSEIGAPDVLGCATGAGETGAAVVDAVDMVQFTGSTRTGRKIAIRAAERLIPASLELGGKDAMIVLSDADMDRAVGGAIWGGMFNAGQSCVAVERVYVEEPVYDEFVQKLTARVSELRQGMDGQGSFEADLGALATQAQLELVARHVDDAVQKGARVTTGGRRSEKGLFYSPTVLVDVDHDMICMQEETFGPTLPVMKVKDEEDAIRLANDTHYGLSGSVWTRDVARGRRIARRLLTGSVCVNNAMVNVFQFPLPQGGWKESGVGLRFGGPAGVLKYCRPQAHVSERVHLKSELHWYPYTAKRGRLQARMVRLMGLHDWRRRFGRSPRS